MIENYNLLKEEEKSIELEIDNLSQRLKDIKAELHKIKYIEIKNKKYLNDVNWYLNLSSYYHTLEIKNGKFRGEFYKIFDGERLICLEKNIFLIWDDGRVHIQYDGNIKYFINFIKDWGLKIDCDNIIIKVLNLKQELKKETELLEELKVL